MDLEFTVNNQTLKRKDSNKLVNCSSEYLQLSFTFETEDWTGLTKYAFFRTGHINYPFELDNTDKIIVPAYFLNGEYLLFGLFGETDGDVRITTNVLRLHLEDSYYDAETVDVRDFLDVEVDRLDTRIDGKVDIVEGKGLSTNDFTNYYKNFIEGFDGNIEEFLEDHKDEIMELLVGEALRSKADKVHTHTKSDITDFTHTHSKSEITDFSHTHSKSDITDFSHTHSKSDITDFAHNHDDRYYTESEVNSRLNGKSDTGHKHTESDISDLQDYALSDDVYSKVEVDNLIYNLNNQMNVTSDKTIIQNTETCNITVQVKEHGFPAENKTVNIYEVN